MNIVFVCTGNTCRSPMAQALFEKKTSDYKDFLTVSSCGLSAMTGDTASENAVKAMSERGIDLSAHRSRQINAYIIDEADLIICLSKSHYKFLEPYAKEKLLILGDGIPDPFMGDEAVYSQCADSIEKAIDDLLGYDIFLDVKPLDKADIEFVARIENDNFSEPWSKEAFDAQIEKTYSVSYTAHYLGKPVGYICCDDVSGEVYVNTIAVDSSFRNRGIAQKLVSKVMEYCNKNNTALLTLEVRVSNAPAINLYKKFGFENLGVRKNFYSKPTENAYIMTKYFNGDTNENTRN